MRVEFETFTRPDTLYPPLHILCSAYCICCIVPTVFPVFPFPVYCRPAATIQDELHHHLGAFNTLNPCIWLGSMLDHNLKGFFPSLLNPIQSECCKSVCPGIVWAFVCCECNQPAARLSDDSFVFNLQNRLFHLFPPDSDAVSVCLNF